VRPLEHLTEQELLGAIRTYQNGAADEFYVRYNGLFYWTMRNNRRWNDNDDVVAEAYVKVFQMIRNFSPALERWSLSTIISHTVRFAYWCSCRQRKRQLDTLVSTTRPSDIDDAGQTRELDRAESIQEDPCFATIINRVTAAKLLQQYTPRHQQVAVLAFADDGYSQNQVARALGISEPRVWQCISRVCPRGDLPTDGPLCNLVKPRDLRIIHLVASGKGRERVAQEIGVSSAQVAANYLKEIYRLTGTRSLLTLGIRYAREWKKGLIPDAPSIGVPDGVIDRNQLSPIKRQALDLLMEGLENKEIAKRLGISLRTVKGYVAQFMEITGLTDRVRIVVREIINQPVLVS